MQGSLASWLGVSPFREREWRFVSVGSDLYSGCAGIALFLAYLGKTTGDDAPRALARAALGTSLEFVWAAEKVDELAPVGLFCGLGGPIYMLSHLGSLWQEPALLDRAEQMALAMERRVLASKEFDLFEGAAGFVASVLSLYRARPSAALLDFARRCGDHIVSHAIQSDGLPGLHWPCGIPSAAPLAGLSHGAAGIALNLMRLWKATDDDRYRRAAEGALEYERSVFSPEAGNWPDFLTFPSSAPVNADAALHREPGFVPRFKTAWCHGAPDTGLSRVAILRITDDPRMRAEIDVAVEATLTEGFGNNHCLCHGDLGNLELLISAPPREQLAADIARLSAAITESITEKGWITGNPLGIESPGLMSGIAGTGFGLLRLLAPQDVPSILLLEPPVAN